MIHRLSNDLPSKPSLRTLYKKSEIEHPSNRLHGWQLQAFEQYKRIVGDESFPCDFATKAFWNDLLLFGFIGKTSQQESLYELWETLLIYLSIVRKLSRKDAANCVLNVFVQPCPSISTAEQYHKQCETILRFLHVFDPSPWCASVSKDQNDPNWAFCFAGVPMFFNFSHPAHTNRLSRVLGDGLVIVLQPRDVFDFYGGKKVRERIRRRIASYDKIPASPWLGTYGESGARESMQYDLSDFNDDPFRPWEIES